MTAQPCTTWTPSLAEGRWCGFGPYYAMFPVQFVRRAITHFTAPGDHVLDPFCGRGTTAFVAQVTGRPSLSADTNPVAWIFASVKTDPYPNGEDILKRVDELIATIRPYDRRAQNEFQRLAWTAEVRAFLKSARRNLDWHDNSLDRTLMAIILVHLHAKLGEGLSNQLRQSKAMAPDYSVRWWTERGMMPPKIDLREFFRKKIDWRYKKGIPTKKASAKVLLGDSREVFLNESEFNAKFILTSPPYCGITNYSYDNWIRLWLLGGPPLPDHSDNARFTNKVDYRELILDVMAGARSVANEDVAVLVRTSAQQYSTSVAVEALISTWPNHGLACRFDKAKGPTQTALFGNSWDKQGEIDLLCFPDKTKVPDNFTILRST